MESKYCSYLSPLLLGPGSICCPHPALCVRRTMLSRSLRHNGGGVNPPSSLPTDSAKARAVKSRPGSSYSLILCWKISDVADWAYYAWQPYHIGISRPKCLLLSTSGILSRMISAPTCSKRLTKSSRTSKYAASTGLQDR